MSKKDIIEKTFMNLLEKHSFQDITIKMISESAHVNRSTFYAHFLDKYDLIDSLIERHLNNIQNIVTEAQLSLSKSSEKQLVVLNFFNQLCDYVYVNKHFFQILLTIHPSQSFSQRLIKQLRTSYLNIVLTEPSLSLPTYFVNYTVGGQFGILFFWLQGGCVESPKEIANILFFNLVKSNR